MVNEKRSSGFRVSSFELRSQNVSSNQKSAIRNQKLFGFTLVELMTVIAIIGLLLGILIPSVRYAQVKARETAVKAQISTLAQGLDLFKTDFGYYPSSVPQDSSGVNGSAYRGVAESDGIHLQVSNATHIIQGFHRMAFALLGRDRLGCPAQRGTLNGMGVSANADKGPDSLKGWYYSTDGTFATPRIYISTASANNRTARKGPYINPEGFKIANDQVNDTLLGGNEKGYMPVLCDKFDKNTNDNITTDYSKSSMVLYFTANEQGKRITGYQQAAPGTTNPWSEEIYYATDNWQITGGDNTTFRQFIEDPKALIGVDHMPHDRDSYLLISAGYDGKYFTGDDIKNWAD
ncbi:MAG: prepilin-type N-terminal cleavage/methylation domain-containing protein [Phycisphaerae bacterium]